MRHAVEVDYNERDGLGRLFARLPAWEDPKVGDPVIAYEPWDGTELDTVIGELGRESNDGFMTWRLVHLDVPQWVVRPIHVCDTPCDTDCDAYCHEGHQVPWKRTPSHPYPRVVDGVES